MLETFSACAFTGSGLSRSHEDGAIVRVSFRFKPLSQQVVERYDVGTFGCCARNTGVDFAMSRCRTTRCSIESCGDKALNVTTNFSQKTLETRGSVAEAFIAFDVKALKTLPCGWVAHLLWKRENKF